MNDSSQPRRSIRRDGWTAERQLRFLDTLASTRSITRAAAAAGMSRESAYRLRKRHAGALFAAAWDRVLEGHRPVMLDRHPRPPRPAHFRANPPKVTRPTSPTDPRYGWVDILLRDLTE